MIIFEQDVRIDEKGNKGFLLRPYLFTGLWKNKLTWRIIWGIWGLSYFPEKGLKGFCKYIESQNTEWRIK
jgi:hypothetical protein